MLKEIYRLGEENSTNQGVWVNFVGLANKLFITHMRPKF